MFSEQSAFGQLFFPQQCI